MKHFFLLLTFTSLHIFSSAQMQAELNAAAHKKFLQSDKELNQVYQTIVSEYKSDTAFITNLKKAQKIWMQFRDAEMQMMYPNREAGYYGSLHPMCWSTYLTELTNERIKKLKRWLEGQQEGASCSSSIKVKQ